MKKALLVISAIILGTWLVVWGISSAFTKVRADDAVASSAAKPWPGGLGTLDSVLERFPPVDGNDASRKLFALGEALPKSDDVDRFVWREMERGERTIDQPPALADTTSIRDLLLRERVVWERRDVEIGDSETTATRALLMRVARALIANALNKAHQNDPAAWDDLHAAWKLARTLDPQPQMMLRTASLSMARMVNAVAWKMPLPAPSWVGELLERDNVRPLLEAYQHQSASYWDDGATLLPTKWLAASVEHDRRIAEELAGTTACEVNVRMNKLGTDLSSVWARAFRYRAEREATANALRIREGKPIESKSVCSDGSWSFDGTTLKFSREVRPGENETAMPLQLRVTP